MKEIVRSRSYRIALLYKLRLQSQSKRHFAVGVAAPSCGHAGSCCKRHSVSRTDYSGYISTRVGDGDVNQWIESQEQIFVFAEFALS